MRNILAIAAGVIIGLALLAGSATPSEASGITRSKSNIANNRLKPATTGKTGRATAIVAPSGRIAARDKHTLKGTVTLLKRDRRPGNRPPDFHGVVSVIK